MKTTSILKVIVRLKIQKLSHHSCVFPNPYEFLLSTEHNNFFFNYWVFVVNAFALKRVWSIQNIDISVWYSNATNQDCKALQRVVRLAERISGSGLPSLQDIYIKRCKSRAAKIIEDSNHPGNHLFHLLPSGKRFLSMMAKTERPRRSFFPQAIRLLNLNSV